MRETALITVWSHRRPPVVRRGAETFRMGLSGHFEGQLFHIWFSALRWFYFFIIWTDNFIGYFCSRIIVCRTKTSWWIFEHSSLRFFRLDEGYRLFWTVANYVKNVNSGFIEVNIDLNSFLKSIWNETDKFRDLHLF